MSAHALMLAARMMPCDLVQLRWLIAESRAMGLECAAEEARIFGATDVAEHLDQRAFAVRNEAINRPPVEVHA